MQKENKSSKSELIKLAINNFLIQQKNIKLKEAVNMMAQEYENEADLTEMTLIDTENFV